MQMITVVYKGHALVLMTDYNGKRYCFEKNKPVDIPEEVWRYILQSEDINTGDFAQVLPETKKEIPKPEPLKEKIKKIIKSKGKRK